MSHICERKISCCSYDSNAGLSVAAVIGIEDGCLVLGGADIVDGSPVLDIKPYLPYVDSVPSAQAPDWVSPGGTRVWDVDTGWHE